MPSTSGISSVPHFLFHFGWCGCFVGADNFVLDSEGVYYALASGVFASGCGYAIWYSALPLIKSTTAATVQLRSLTVASPMGWIALAEPPQGRFWLLQ